MNESELRKFCGNKKTFEEPWTIGQYSYATNSSMLIRIPRVDTIPETKSASEYFHKVPEMFNDFDRAMMDYWVKPVEYTPTTCPKCNGEKVSYACQECDGDGGLILSSDYNDYDVQCKSCNGSGQSPREAKGVSTEPCSYCEGEGTIDLVPMPHVQYGNHGFSVKNLALLSGLSNVKIIPQKGEKDPALILFDGGEGLIMPMIPERG